MSDSTAAPAAFIPRMPCGCRYDRGDGCYVLVQCQDHASLPAHDAECYRRHHLCAVKRIEEQERAITRMFWVVADRLGTDEIARRLGLVRPADEKEA